MNYYGKKMINRYEYVDLFSEKEYERRIAGVRNEMKENGVQIVIFLECAEEAYDEWLLGKRFLDYMIVPEEGEAIGVMYGELDETICNTDLEHTDYDRYLMQRPVYPLCEGVRFINRVSDDRIAGLIAENHVERIGLVLPEFLTASLKDAILDKIPNVEFVDVSIPIATFRAVKSDEEMFAAKQSVIIQKKIYDALPQIIRIGRSTKDIQDEVTYYAHSLGASGCVHCHIVYNGSQDTPAPHINWDDRGATVREGDRFFALMESNGPGHHHCAFGRHLVIGDVHPEYAKVVEADKKVHQFAVSMMKPGETLANIAVKTRKFANELGYRLKEDIGWNWMHSLGYYYFEQYALERFTETVPLKSNIILHCHPMIYRNFPELGETVCEECQILNTYYVDEDGAHDLTGIPLDIKVLY